MTNDRYRLLETFRLVLVALEPHTWGNSMDRDLAYQLHDDLRCHCVGWTDKDVDTAYLKYLDIILRLALKPQNAPVGVPSPEKVI